MYNIFGIIIRYRESKDKIKNKVRCCYFHEESLLAVALYELLARLFQRSLCFISVCCPLRFVYFWKISYDLTLLHRSNIFPMFSRVLLKSIFVIVEFCYYGRVFLWSSFIIVEFCYSRVLLYLVEFC